MLMRLPSVCHAERSEASEGEARGDERRWYKFWHQMLRCAQHDKRLVLVVELGPLLRARYSTIPRQLPLLNAFFPCFNKTAYFCEKSARMSQVILELDNRDDLALLLTFVRRLNINVVAVRPSTKNAADQKDAENRIALMRQAASDPLFLADIADVTSSL